MPSPSRAIKRCCMEVVSDPATVLLATPIRMTLRRRPRDRTLDFASHCGRERLFGAAANWPAWSGLLMIETVAPWGVACHLSQGQKRRRTGTFRLSRALPLSVREWGCDVANGHILVATESPLFQNLWLPSERFLVGGRGAKLARKQCYSWTLCDVAARTRGVEATRETSITYGSRKRAHGVVHTVATTWGGCSITSGKPAPEPASKPACGRSTSPRPPMSRTSRFTALRPLVGGRPATLTELSTRMRLNAAYDPLICGAAPSLDGRARSAPSVITRRWTP